MLFDPYSVESLVETLKQILEDHDLRMILCEKGLSRVKSFSWAACARKTLDVLETAGQD